MSEKTVIPTTAVLTSHIKSQDPLSTTKTVGGPLTAVEFEQPIMDNYRTQPTEKGISQADR